MGNIRFNRDKYIFACAPAMLLVGGETESMRTRQISLFLSELVSYNVILKDLINYPIKENQRNLALNIAYYIIEDVEFSEKVDRRKDLPVKQLSKLTKIQQNNLERLKDYIITYYLILRNPEYKSIQNLLKVKLKRGSKAGSTVNKKYTIYKGIALKCFRKSAYIITSTGEFINIKTNERVRAGSICDGKERAHAKKYKLPIAITLVVLIFLCCATVVEYKRTQSIIVIETTSTIKMHVNKFNKVIYAYSPTEKGKKLIENTFVQNENFDDAMVSVFEYAKDHEMIDTSKKTIITVTGTPLKYGVLSETNKFITENKIPILINNSGNEQTLPEYIPKDDD